MESNETNIEEYERILNWFVTNKDKSERIHKSGKNKKDKWWFTIDEVMTQWWSLEKNLLNIIK